MDNSLISIVIPARNEEFYLPICLASIEEASKQISSKTEIVVVINRCTDRTEEIAKAHGAKIVHEDAKNLSKIRNAGINGSTGDTVVTIDADSRMNYRLLKKIEEASKDPKYIGGAVMMFPERWSLGIAFTFLALTPYVFIHRIAGGVFFFSREAFDNIDGFDESFPSAEDIDFAKRLRRYGKKNGRKFKIVVSSWIITSCRKFDRFGDWFFLKKPLQTFKLLKGKDSEAADKIWFDFES